MPVVVLAHIQNSVTNKTDMVFVGTLKGGVLLSGECLRRPQMLDLSKFSDACWKKSWDYLRLFPALLSLF